MPNSLCLFWLALLAGQSGAPQVECVLLECDINQRAIDIVEKALETKPCLIGIGFTYGMLLGSVVHLLKKVSPQTIVVLGARDSFEIEKQMAQEGRPHHHYICFRKLCETSICCIRFQSTVADTRWPARTFTSRFSLRALSEEDLRYRVIYVEGHADALYLRILFIVDAPVKVSTRTIFLHKCKDC